MADKSIGDLNPVPSTIDDSNTLFVVQQSGAAYKVTGANFISAITAVLDGHGGIKDIEYTAPVSPSLDGTLTITLADDTETEVTVSNGKGIASITDYWKASSSSSSVPSSWSTTRETMTSTNRYLWHYQRIAYNDGSYLDTTKTIVGVYGDTGQAWYIWIRYAGSCTGTPPMPPTDSDMGTTPDNWMGIYSGTASTAPTSRSSYTWFEIKGEKGDTGDSITSVSKTSTVGLVDTYTVYAGSPAVSVGTFTVTNGQDGEGSPSSNIPEMDSGNGSAGSSLSFARGDHVHPTDTSRASQADLTTLQGTVSTAQGDITSLQTAMANKVIYLTNIACAATTGDFVQISITGCTESHVLVSVVFSNPLAITSDITWRTWADGGFTINGTCTDATCTASIVLIKKDN